MKDEDFRNALLLIMGMSSFFGWFIMFLHVANSGEIVWAVIVAFLPAVIAGWVYAWKFMR